MRKRALALLMTLCMVLSLVTPAMAAEGDVAQIGEQTYATLNKAIDAAADGATIQLLGDATLSTTAFPSGKTITIVGTNASGENKMGHVSEVFCSHDPFCVFVPALLLFCRVMI